MGDFNKVLSFVLGLIVVVVFIAVIASRSNLRNHLAFLSDGKVTPTPKVSVTPTPSPKKDSQPMNNYKTQTVIPTVAPKKVMIKVLPTQTIQFKPAPTQNTQSYNNKQLSTIPQTGPSILMLPTLLSMLGTGIYLRKKGK